MPKLIRPALIKKEYYHTAISWLRENTEPDSEIGTFDPKITFYAERKSIFSNINTPPQKGDFWVQEITPDFETAHPVLMTRQVFAYPHPHENKTVSIFDMKGYINESISLIDFHYQWIDKRVLECVFDFRVYQYPKSDYTISVRSRFEKTVSNKKETKTMILSFIPSIPTGSWQDGTTIQVKKRLAFPPVPMKLEMFFYIPNGSVYGREVFLANISDPVQKPVTGSD